MSNQNLVKLALVLILAAVMVGGNHTMGPWIQYGIVAFGVFNIVFSPPGTAGVRALAIAASIAALALPNAWWGIILVIGWLVWPPAYAVAWSLGRRAADAPPPVVDGSDEGRRAKTAAAAIITAVAFASAAYRILVQHQLQQTSALFVGLPAIIAVIVVLTVSPRTAIGVATKAVTVGLLVSLLFLGEGLLCVLMSAPLFYFVAIAIAAVMQGSRDRVATLRSCLVLLVVAPLSLEGVTGPTTIGRDETVTVSRIVRASPEAIGDALFAPPRFERALPFYLRAGFPRALSTRIERGNGSSDPARWIVTMRGGEMRLNGMEARTGDLVLELAELRPGLVRWRAASDTSHMTHFLAWQEASVQWEPVGPGLSAVTWTLRYRRGLDPAWYFGPWERYAVQLAAGYLIDAVATP